MISCDHPQQHGEREVVLGSVATVDRRLCDPAAGGDALDRETVDAMLNQQLARRFEDLVVGYRAHKNET